MSPRGPPAERRLGVLAEGVVAGGGAYVVGYVVTFLLMRGPARRVVEGSVPTWKVVGWYHYNAHFVDVVARRSVGALGGSEAVNLLAESSADTATFVYAVPPMALVLAGGAVAWRRSDADVLSAATGGAATVIGYGPLAVLGALVVPHETSAAVLGLEFSSTVILPVVSVGVVAGLVYPLVLGTTGAVLWSVLGDGAAALGPARS